MTGQDSNSICEAIAQESQGSLLDCFVSDDLDREILSYPQRNDPQTGLLNQRAFQDALAARLRSSPAGQGIALIWIDLASLRREFSLRGWKGAEALARRIAATLRSIVEDAALLGQVGNSSFLVAMKATKLSRTSRHCIQKVMDALVPLRQNGSETKLGVAAGVAFFPSDTDSAEDLVRFATVAADHASSINSRKVIAFQPKMNSRIVRDNLLEVEMSKGLDQGRFLMFYQPKVSLITGQVLGAEALMRWNHPELGAIAPDEFIPIAERSELIHRVFEFSLRTALEYVRHLHTLGLSLPIIAVNASVANVREEGFARIVRSIMKEIPIAPTQLELEITESLAFDNEELFRARVRQLRTIGVRISIDDFGTRYTGFNVLKKLRLDTIKIDQCFIQGIDLSQNMLSVCKTIVAMSRQLKMRTIAEGIEEPGELNAARQIGCEVGQGYLFQRPIGTEDFTAFLREWPSRMRDFGFGKDRGLFDADPPPLYAAG